MNYSRKNNISQQKNDGQSDFLGITQSSGLDHLSGYPDKRSFAVSGQHLRRKAGAAGGRILRHSKKIGAQWPLEPSSCVERLVLNIDEILLSSTL